MKQTRRTWHIVVGAILGGTLPYLTVIIADFIGFGFDDFKAWWFVALGVWCGVFFGRFGYVSTVRAMNDDWDEDTSDHTPRSVE